ncbi:uncharacterized protein LOC118431010 [Branchiostoma floridae]|uniref:Uncharacterized protein LOC118431010 n=1 Tax=Branchiostoma floridae TaxID=7739 RepID=A0A9J7MEZ1_BRAFL|nr:uncharacterized protein LOC118431010 [Branchiostoma floridae]
MALVALFVLCVVAAFPGQCLGAANPPEGQCCYYNWGGPKKLHFYVCCNNCDENDGDPVCGGTVYDKASDGDYCGKCGEDDGIARSKNEPFDCGGCAGQTTVKAVCDRRYWWVFKGFCWVWADCFALRCKRLFPQDGEDKQALLQSGSYMYDAFCGNDECDPGEDHYNCPFDCCPRYNPETCRRGCNYQCPPLCCSQPGCCMG